MFCTNNIECAAWLAEYSLFLATPLASHNLHASYYEEVWMLLFTLSMFNLSWDRCSSHLVLGGVQMLTFYTHLCVLENVTCD